MRSELVQLMAGKRKMTFGTVCFTQLWIAFMWAPGYNDITRTAILQLMGVLLGLVIGGNVAEHFSKNKPSD